MAVSNKIRFRFAVLAAIAIFASIALATTVRSQSNTTPQYTPGGELVTPSGFETWVFVGSNLGLAYKHELPVTTAKESAQADARVFHNIYINPEAYAYFKEKHEFPELTMLVMEIFTASDKEPKNVLSAGVYNDQRIGLQVAVKDSTHPSKPSNSPWAYYIPQDWQDDKNHHPLLPSSEAFGSASCESCHKDHASMDHVWVQFYPTLRKLLAQAPR
jgi:Cytochrome P460